MNKLLIYFLSGVVIVLSFVIGLRFFAFTSTGNSTVKTYIQTSLQEQIAMPIKVYNFILDEEKMQFSVNINGQMQIDIHTQYNMLTQYFAGVYYLRAEEFTYKNLHLRDANLSGRFKGRRGNMQIQGQGEALGADLLYRLHLKNSEFKHIEAKVKGLKTNEAFAIIGEKALFGGSLDLDITLPKLGDSHAKGQGTVILNKAFFDTKHIQDRYGITLPSQSHVLGTLTMKLEGKTLGFSSHAKSNIFDLLVKNASINVDKRTLYAEYILDMDNLSLFTKNTLIGIFKVNGNILYDNDTYHIKGESRSWGGHLGFDISKESIIKLHNVHVDKLLYATKQEPLAKGLLTATAHYSIDKSQGNYSLQVDKGIFLADNIDKLFGYQIPSMNSFSLYTHGLLKEASIDLKATLKSSIGDIELKEAKYDISRQSLSSDYELFLPNIGLLIRGNRAVKRGYMSAKGEAILAKDFTIKGKAKGLGGEFEFTYDKNTSKIEAPEIFIEKLLSLMNISRYVTGRVETIINLKDKEKLDGNFSLSSQNLRTEPRMIEKAIGKRITVTMKAESKGEIKDGNISVSTYLESKIARLRMDNMHIDTKAKIVKSPYVLDIPELKNAYELTGKKLYGPMKFEGFFSHDKTLNLNGKTKSLGGEITYRLLDKVLVGKINKVSLENILLLLGRDALFGGEVIGDINYHFEDKKGSANIKIASFHLKPSSTTKKLKLFIGKDPTRIIYKDTTLHAQINENNTTYTLRAIGSHSRIEIKNGMLDKKTDTHSGIFTFIYDKYEITGNIVGSIHHPKLELDPSAIMDNPMGKKIQNKLNHALGDEMGKAVSGFLKGLKL